MHIQCTPVLNHSFFCIEPSKPQAHGGVWPAMGSGLRLRSKDLAVARDSAQFPR